MLFGVKRSLLWLACLCVAALPADAAKKPPKPSVQQVTLRSQVFGNTRQIRVLLPPGYTDSRNAAVRYPVFYFFDGIAAFEAWGVVDVAYPMMEKGEIPLTLFVGIDNGGSTRESENPVSDRASEYLPYPDQSWVTSDAPTPRADRLPAFFDEVETLVASKFRTQTDGRSKGLAGYSFSGIAALFMAMKRPGQFEHLLVESPSLHIGDGRLLVDALAFSAWPRAVYLGVGSAEGEERVHQKEMLDNVRSLEASLRQRPGLRVHVEVTPDADHGYAAWNQRLPVALRFLLAAKRDQ